MDNRKLIFAAIAGIILAIAANYFFKSDKDLIRESIEEIQEISETRPFPTVLLEQAKIVRKVQKFLDKDIQAIDEVNDPDDPIAINRDEVQKIILIGLRLCEEVDTQINDLQIQVHDENRATTTFVLDYTLKFRNESFADGVIPAEVEWSKTSGEWTVVSMKRLNLFE